MSKKIVLFTLQTFSTTGGIQKMTRTLAYCLNNLAENNGWDFKLWSAYDTNSEIMPQYLPAKNFRGFGVKKTSFVINTINSPVKPDIVIISHVNIAVIGLITKLLNPKCQVWLIAHGIEVWRPLSRFKRLFLKRCDKIICVSNFTRQQMIEKHGVNAHRCHVLNNAVDPFMKLPSTFEKPLNLLKRYGITNNRPIVFTLTRLASTEQYKGHDQVIKVISRLKAKFPDIIYILSGQYDLQEEVRIRNLIADYGVTNNVILTGFIEEVELAPHFLLADLFVLPSKKEGFGIVFIEALACGLPVICGNADGSVDAIRNGELGTAINADDLDELESKMAEYLNIPTSAETRKFLQDKCLQHFNEIDYMGKLNKLINDRD